MAASLKQDYAKILKAGADLVMISPDSLEENRKYTLTLFGEELPYLYVSDSNLDIAGRYGLSPSLVESVIRVESAFNAAAVSRKGAQGLMQLMPRTATSLGVRNAFDPKQNIEGGVRHLRYLIDRYPGNLPLALAAYNAGAGAVDTYRGIPPYPETQDYVRKILQIHGGGVGVSQPIFRYEDGRGSVTYTNVPPAGRVRLR